MPEVTGPLFSPDARGDLAKLLNYHKRPGGFAVAKHHQPGSVVASHALPSAAQTVIRAYVKEAVEHWQQLTTEEKELWNLYVK